MSAAGRTKKAASRVLFLREGQWYELPWNEGCDTMLFIAQCIGSAKPVRHAPFDAANGRTKGLKRLCDGHRTAAVALQVENAQLRQKGMAVVECLRQAMREMCLKCPGSDCRHHACVLHERWERAIGDFTSRADTEKGAVK